MKLLFCTSCHDLVNLGRVERTCECGKVGGRYLTDIDAIYWGGEHAVPVGITNSSFMEAVVNRPGAGMGYLFTAFVIPHECDTMRLLNKSKQEKVGDE